MPSAKRKQEGSGNDNRAARRTRLQDGQSKAADRQSEKATDPGGKGRAAAKKAPFAKKALKGKQGGTNAKCVLVLDSRPADCKLRWLTDLHIEGLCHFFVSLCVSLHSPVLDACQLIANRLVALQAQREHHTHHHVKA
jgi:hypothetical protein